MEDTDPIACTAVVRGVEVRGVIIWHDASDIVVEITWPFTGVQNGAHLMPMARCHVNYDGAAGRRRASELLVEIHEWCSRGLQRLHRLRPSLEAFHARELVLAPRLTLLEAERKALRRAFKDGSINQCSYQRALAARRGAAEAIRETLRSRVEQIIRRHVSPTVPEESQEQLLRFLWQRCRAGEGTHE